MRPEYKEAAEKRDLIAELVSTDRYTLVQIARELGIPYLRVKKLWRQIRENLGAQAR